jgi:mRNA interferase MazF
MKVNRFEVYLINLDPTIGAEIEKTRPCVIISPDEMNKHISTIIIAPLTTQIRNYPTRIDCRFQNKQGQIVLDQLRAIDKKRLLKKLGKIDVQTQTNVLRVLQEIFAP